MEENNKKQGGARRYNMVKPFWVTCPKCKEKVASPMAWVLKYLERIGYEARAKERD